MRHLLGSGPAARGAALVFFLMLGLLRSVSAFAADTTAPTKPTVTDDGAYTTSTTSLHATWTSSDPESGIVEYQYLIRQDSTSGAIIVNWASTGTTASVTRTGLSLVQGKKYYVGVKAKNGDGLWSSVGYSDGIKVDTTAPSAPGLPQEGSSTSDLDYDGDGSYTVYWVAASDVESGISVYEVQERVGPAGSWTSLTNSRTSTNFAVSGRLDKTTYFYQVRAKNKAGLWGSWSSPSDGILIDKTVPSAVTVTDDGVTTYSTTSLHATWTTSSDAESGIVEYQYRIRQDSTSGTVIVDWTSVGLPREVTRTGLSLVVGKKYYVGVRAKNGASLYSSIRYSDGILVQADTNPPTGTISINNGALYTMVPMVTLTLSATDNSGVVSQMQFSNDNITYTPAEPYAMTKPLTLPSGDGSKTVYVKFSDPSNNWSSPTSDAITLDTTPPTTPVVTDDGDTTAVNDRLHATWTSSDAQSSIVEYQWAIGTSPGTADVAGWLSVGTATEGTRPGLALQESITYYVNVKAKNGAESWSAVGSSNGIRYVSITPPQVRIDTPAASFTTNAMTQDVAGTVTTESTVNGVTITVTTGGTPQPAQTAPVASGRYNATVSLEREGAASILVEATDAGGQRGSATVSGTVDRTPPALDITSPEPGTVFTD